MSVTEIIKNILAVLFIFGMIALIVIMLVDMQKIEKDRIAKEYIIVEKNSLGDTLTIFDPATNYDCSGIVVTFTYKGKQRRLVQNFTVEEK